MRYVSIAAGKEIGIFEPDRKDFPHLPHPPVIVRDLIGDQLAGTRFSRHDQTVLKRIVGKILAVGLESLSLRDKLSIAVLLVGNHMSMSEGEDLVGRSSSAGAPRTRAGTS